MGNWAYFFFSSKIPSEVYWIWAKQGFWEDWNQSTPRRPYSLSKDVWTGISLGTSINPLIKILLGELREKRSQFSNIVKLLATPPGARASPDAETTLHLCSSWNMASTDPTRPQTSRPCLFSGCAQLSSPFGHLPFPLLSAPNFALPLCLSDLSPTASATPRYDPCFIENPVKCSGRPSFWLNWRLISHAELWAGKESLPVFSFHPLH